MVVGVADTGVLANHEDVQSVEASTPDAPIWDDADKFTRIMPDEVERFVEIRNRMNVMIEKGTDAADERAAWQNAIEDLMNDLDELSSDIIGRAG